MLVLSQTQADNQWVFMCVRSL